MAPRYLCVVVRGALWTNGTSVRVSVRPAVGQFVRVGSGRVQRQGVGIHYSLDGSVFHRAWSGDRMNGQGECVHGNGIKYKVLI